MTNFNFIIYIAHLPPRDWLTHHEGNVFTQDTTCRNKKSVMSFIPRADYISEPALPLPSQLQRHVLGMVAGYLLGLTADDITVKIVRATQLRRRHQSVSEQ